MRANERGDFVFYDHVDISIVIYMRDATNTQTIRKVTETYAVLILVDGMSNYLWAGVQADKSFAETTRAMKRSWDDLKCVPKVIVGDDYFCSPSQAQELLKFYQLQGIKDFITQGANTPWPNRAEAAVN